ncbi:MAG: hypothetical protein ACXWP5_11640 [Bdellovibrionota bacterium]
MQKWRKLGKVINPGETFPAELGAKSNWMHEAASLPVVEKIDGDHLKVHFSPRDPQGRSLMSWVVVEPKKNFRIVDVATAPLVSLGSPGFFDDSGTMGTELIEWGGKKYFYYCGWNRSVEVPFRNALGLAVASKGTDHYRKYAEGPILDRSPFDPCMVASCSIIQVGDRLRMYYLSCIRWEKSKDTGQLQHVYHLKIAESNDGIQWSREGKVAIEFKYPGEYAIATPRVLLDGAIYKMWYSYRAGPKAKAYRIGYAESQDSIHWDRKDELVGLDVTEGAWDSDMVCYPYVVDFQGERYMFYNGNRYGLTGVGVAVLER